MNDELITVTKLIDVNNVSKVYSGKPGCMCGCLGTYNYSSTSND